MKWTRPLLLIAMMFLAGGVGVTLYSRFKQQSAEAARKPKALETGINSTAQEWTYTKMDGNRPVVFVKAKDYRDVNGQFALTGVELHLFQKQGDEFDLVKSANASYDSDKGMLFSDGEVEIVLGVPKDEEPSGKLMQIKSSGVFFETKTGKATTGRPAVFAFDRGDGKATGASYDPQTRELHLSHDIHLIWRGTDHSSPPMNVEAGEITYKEKESKVYLDGWSKLTRDTLTLNAGPAVVTLADGLIHQVDTERASGSDVRPNRNIEYAADKLTMLFDDAGQIQTIIGERNARLVSHADTADTTVTSDRLDLAFNTESGDSVLVDAVATGHSAAESKPVAKPGVDPADTRILRSEVIRIRMKPDGQQIDNVETDSAAAIEFIPNRPGQPHRWMNGDKVWLRYAMKNQLESLRSVNVTTRTLKPRAKDAKEDPPPALTWSKELHAEFDNKNQISRLEQWNDFRYEEGLRKAKADRALLEQQQNIIHLTGSSRVWDNTGSTDGDRIVFNQKNGDMSAEGNVNSTRLPDKKKDGDSGGGMLAEDEPLHARAKKMTSTDNNLQVRYEGDAVAWQGANRIQAETIEIDRDNNVLKAHGNVISQLLDKKKGDGSAPDDAPKTGSNETSKHPAPDSKPAPPSFTVVHAPDLLYQDDDRLAVYTGGVLLDRSGMKVKSQLLRAFLRDDSDDSSLDHAVAEGQVEIVQSTPGRIRTGTSEHAEYYVDDAKVIMEKGHPQLADTLKGSTRGRKLTWFSDDDRLLVEGEENQPAQSKLLRKHASGK